MVFPIQATHHQASAARPGGHHRADSVPSAHDASAYTRIDANTLIIARFKAGKLIAVGTLVISPDGKTFTNNNTGLGSAPGAMTGIAVFDKQ